MDSWGVEEGGGSTGVGCHMDRTKCCLGFQGATLSYDHHTAITIIAALQFIGIYRKSLHSTQLSYTSHWIKVVILLFSHLLLQKKYENRMLSNLLNGGYLVLR